MKLLIITQKVNKDDPWLSFFHGWIAEFSKRFEKIEVICLEAGKYDLPSNVSVFSLGKEIRPSRMQYVKRFFGEIIRKRNEYDAVFVHMNQEYVLLAGWLWRLWGKKVYMWRNHHAGSMLTDIAAVFCTNVFCTSKFSYTAKYRKTILMPVGIDTALFKADPDTMRIPHSILFFGRVAPSKRPDLFIEALGDLKKEGIDFRAAVYGDSLPKDRDYHQALKVRAKELGLSGSGQSLLFHAGMPNRETPAVYSAYGIFVNLSSSGMYDKMIFEAMACDSLVLASNKNLDDLIRGEFIFKEGDRQELVLKLKHLLSLNAAEQADARKELQDVVEKHHSLVSLANKLASIIIR